MLRGFRKGLKVIFFGDKGKASKEHHWKIEKWEDEARKCLESYGFMPTDEQVFQFMTLLYPTFGKTEKGSGNPTVNKGLGLGSDIKRFIYNQTILKGIFDKNKEMSRDLFFKDDFMKDLWVLVIK